MPTGIILSVNEDRATGTITGTLQEDETGSTFDFNDPNFSLTGLKVGDHCSFDIDYTQRVPLATNLKPYDPASNNIEITTVISGPYTVNPLETVIVKNGGAIKGSIGIKNGKLIVGSKGVIEGDIVVDDNGSLVTRNGGMVTGNITMLKGTALKVVGGGAIKGSIGIKSGNRFIVGNDTNGGGTISGPISIDQIRHVEITSTSKINI